MSIAASVMKRVEDRLPKVMGSRAHSAIDCLQVAFFLGMAWRWRRKQPRAAVAALLSGSFLLGEALFTDYPLGAVKVLPFAAHGRMDAAFAVSSLRIPKVFGFEGTAEAAVFQSNGMIEVVVVGLTDYESAPAPWIEAA